MNDVPVKYKIVLSKVIMLICCNYMRYYLNSYLQL